MNMEKKYDKKFRIIFEVLDELLGPPPEPPKEPMGFRLEKKWKKLFARSICQNSPATRQFFLWSPESKNFRDPLHFLPFAGEKISGRE